jgi:hypothetical protein
MPKGIKNNLSNEIINDIIYKYNNGKSANQLAIEYKLKCSKSITLILNKNNIKIRDKKEAGEKSAIVFSEAEIKAIIELNENTFKSLNDISSTLNYDPKTIKKYLIKLNLYDPLKYDKYLINKFDTSCEEQAYWLGMLAADGGISTNNKQISLLLKESDLSHIEKYKKFVGVDYNIGKTTSIINNKIFHGYKYTISSVNFIKSLKKHGLINKKSLTLNFNKTIPENMIHHYIRGLIDGDGSYHITKQNNIRISLVSSLEVCLKVQEYLIKNCNLNKTKLTERIANTGEKYYYLHYTGAVQCKRIIEYLYKDATIFLDRKKELVDNYLKTHIFRNSINKQIFITNELK